MKFAIRLSLFALGFLGALLLLSGPTAWAKDRHCPVPSTINFGSVTVGQSASATVTVVGIGGAKRTKYTVVVPPGTPFTATPTSFTVRKGKSKNVTITFSPITPGPASTNISFNACEVTVVGIGIIPATATPTSTPTATPNLGAQGSELPYLNLFNQLLH